jgi:hypothetical protein
MTFLRLLLILSCATLSACDKPIETVNRQNDFLTAKPPSKLFKVGDIWGIQSSGLDYSMVLLCNNDQSIPVQSSAGQEYNVVKSLGANSKGDVTVDVNRMLAELAIPLPLASLPQINTALQGGGKFVRNASFQVSNVTFDTAPQQTLVNSYNRLVTNGSCSVAQGQEAYVIEQTLTATVIYDISWDASFDASLQAQLAELAKGSLNGDAVLEGGRKISGSALVYGVRLLDPKNPTKLVTGRTLYIVAAGRVLRVS